MSDNTVKYISLNEDVVNDIRNIFISGAARLKTAEMEEDEFNGDIMARKGENITYVNFFLPDDFSRIPDNQADMSEYNIEEDIPKSIFWYEEGRYLFQVFNKRNILKRKTVLKVEYGNSFAKMQEKAFVIEEKVNAIYEDGKFYFQSYTSANQIFPLLDFVTEATNGEIDSFGENENLEANAVRIKDIANVKTRRLIKVLSSTTNVSTFIGKSLRTKKSLLKKYGIKAQINNEGKLILPTHNVSELNRTLEFLNEDIFRGVITNSLYKSNSKKKDQ
jgi:hypothetical protein